MDAKAVDVLVVGGGPAGMLAACLLAREGLHVLVAERNENFDREFRGEILQPRFHRTLAEVGLLEHVKGYPHEEVEAAHIYFQGIKVGEIPLGGLDPESGAPWWMTQPTLLRALQDYGARFPGFELAFDAALERLESGVATLQRPDGAMRVRARVVIGADGRFSAVRRLAQMEMRYDRHDVDVLWFTIPRPPGYRHVFSFFLSLSQNTLILPKHPDLLQCGMILAPDTYARLRKRGIGPLREDLRQAHPLLRDFADGLEKFTQFHPLIGNRACVRTWAQDGLVLIGDAAHTCSPAGGIGVSIAVETAVVAAGVVHDCFRRGDFSARALGEVQRVRQPAVDRVHRAQGNARIAVRAPRLLRRLIPVAMRVASRLGLLRNAVGGLLARREPLPLYGLRRGA